MRKIAVLLVSLALWPGVLAAQPVDRYHELLSDSVESPVWWVEAVGAGVIDQADDFPREWSANRYPFVERNTARVGQAFVSSVVEAGVAVPFHQHVGYEPCGCRGALRRTGHAVWRTIVQRRIDGGLAPNVPFLIAKYGSAAVAKVWYPASYRAGDIVAQGTFAIGTGIGLNLLAEFSPDLLHVLHLR